MTSIHHSQSAIYQPIKPTLRVVQPTSNVFYVFHSSTSESFELKFEIIGTSHEDYFMNIIGTATPPSKPIAEDGSFCDRKELKDASPLCFGENICCEKAIEEFYATGHTNVARQCRPVCSYVSFPEATEMKNPQPICTLRSFCARVG